MDDPTWRQQAHTYLKLLAIYIDDECRDSTLFGTLVDSWYCYHRGGLFVKPTGNPRTLNAPKIHERLQVEAMSQLPFISLRAQAVIERRSAETLVKDHVVPRSFLRRLALSRRNELTTPETIRAFLLRWYHVAAITHGEHQELKEARLNDCMPVGWDEQDCFARYREAGIRGSFTQRT